MPLCSKCSHPLCDVCGADLTGRQRRFCSRKCSKKYYRRPYVYANGPACEFCGHKIPRGRRNFCSDLCSNRDKWEQVKFDPERHEREKARQRIAKRHQAAAQKITFPIAA